MLVLHVVGLASESVALVHPDQDLILMEDGLDPDVEDEALRQALAAASGRWDLAPDAHLAHVPQQRTSPPHLRIIRDDAAS